MIKHFLKHFWWYLHFLCWLDSVKISFSCKWYCEPHVTLCSCSTETQTHTEKQVQTHRHTPVQRMIFAALCSSTRTGKAWKHLNSAFRATTQSLPQRNTGYCHDNTVAAAILAPALWGAPIKNHGPVVVPGVGCGGALARTSAGFHILQLQFPPHVGLMTFCGSVYFYFISHRWPFGKKV